MKTPAHALALTLTALAMLLLSACGAGNPASLDEAPRSTNRTGSSSSSNSAPHLVHVDQTRRIVTLCRGSNELVDGFLIAETGSENQQTAVLKSISAAGQSTSRRTADILEGSPSINDRVRNATTAESAELSKLYRD